MSTLLQPDITKAHSAKTPNEMISHNAKTPNEMISYTVSAQSRATVGFTPNGQCLF